MRRTKLEQHLIESYDLPLEQARRIVSEARAELKMKPWQGTASPQLWKVCEVRSQKKTTQFLQEKKELKDAIALSLQQKSSQRKKSPYKQRRARSFCPPTELTHTIEAKAQMRSQKDIPAYINIRSHGSSAANENKTPPTSPFSSTSSKASRESIAKLAELVAMTVPRVIDVNETHESADGFCMPSKLDDFFVRLQQ